MKNGMVKNWIACVQCGLPVGCDDDHPKLPCGARCHVGCIAEHKKHCAACLRRVRLIESIVVLAELGNEEP